MNEQPKILIVDDEAKVRRLLRNLLEDEGFIVFEAVDSPSTLDALATQDLQLITLDIHLGSDNGFELARDIRKLSTVPIVMLTGKNDVIDRVVGLELGADDYITKPFHVREVVARIRAVLRRQSFASAEGSKPCDELLQRADCAAYSFDGVTVLPDRLEVRGRKGGECKFTSGDIALLKVFIEHPKRALSRDQLMDLTGGIEWSPLDRTIDNQVARLRKKIERNPSTPKLIKTVRGVGYMFACDVDRVSVQGDLAKTA